MQDILGILVFRIITRGIGQHARYYFFYLIGKKRPFKSFSNESKDEYKDLGNALTQDFLNAIIGTIIFLIVTLIVVWVIFS